MVNKIESYEKSSKKDQKLTKKRSRTWKLLAIALYITFLLLSTIPFAADKTVETTMKDSYTYHLTYRTDGHQSHYYVERINTSTVGKIDLTYTTASNSLEVETENIKKIHIYCRSMYEDECKKVFGFDPEINSNYYKWYFIEKNHLNVNIKADHEIEELSFIDTPIPSKVLVNGEPWVEGTNYKYTDNFSTALSNVPIGNTNVDIYFKSDTESPPTAVLFSSKTIACVNEKLVFDASNSYDLDGTIKSYIFDFGDGNFRSGISHIYSYSEPGIYGVILTVRDDDYLIDHEYLNITVVESSDIPEIQGIVPNQIKREDAPPWSLDLAIYTPIPHTNDTEFYWYITGEMESLYTVLGENNSDKQLIFNPIPNAFGNNLVKLWLRSSKDIAIFQYMWVNITPVNDPPKILHIPDLILHYDDPYTFKYEPYISDIETPNDELIMTIYDGYSENFIVINGLSATFNYPQKYVGTEIFATLKVSDSDNSTQKVFSIAVTTDYVPKLTKELPDIFLYEGTTKFDVFDLDDYFTDPDDDSIFFSYGYTHLSISINPDHTVDISAESEWTGTELVTFRARDPVGALAEDSILVTVIPVNDPPEIENVPDFIIRYNYNYRFDLTPYLYDNDNSTNQLKIMVSDPEHIQLDFQNKRIIIMNYPESFLGKTEHVRLIVTDGLSSDFQEITVTITDDYPPELIKPIPDIVFLEDELYEDAINLNEYFLDIDGDALYYTTGNKSVNIKIKSDNKVDFSAPPNWFGNENVYFRATDPSGALQEDLILVTVLPVNDPPKIIQIPKQYGNESERWVLDLDKYIFDVDNNLSELEIYTDNDYAIVSGNILIFWGSPEMPDKIELLVSDGEFVVSSLIDIKLNLDKPQKSPTIWDLITQLIPFVLLIVIIIIIIQIVVYQKKSAYDVEEVFLIHRGGTLINHLIKYSQANVDDVIFSGMFTAVQDFIQDTFVNKNNINKSDSDSIKHSNDWVLDELKLGSKKILIERTVNVYLAVIFTGEGSKQLRRKIKKLLDKIENKYGTILVTWDGDMRSLKGTKDILKKLITPIKSTKSESKSQNKNKPQNSGVFNNLRNTPIQNTNTAQNQSLQKPSQTSTQIMSQQITQAKTQIHPTPIKTGANNASALKGTINQPLTRKPVKIRMSDTGSEIEIDPTRSILQQLAELEEMENTWPN